MSKLAKALRSVTGTATAAGGGLNVEDVFSTYLYTGNGSTQTITNGIDLDGKGGMVWLKDRDLAENNCIYDTERGDGALLVSNTNAAQSIDTFNPFSFTSSGFFVGQNFGGSENNSGNSIASWTFRKAPKFFDVVTYTGDGTTGRQISHNLDATVGMMILKETSGSGYWGVYHRSVDSTSPEDYVLLLNSTSARIDEQFFINDTAPTSTHFTVGATAASGGDFNTNGDTYVAYLFAHNDGDGEFGSEADQDIIKCGSFVGNGSTDGPEIDLGFEPQWILTKGATQSGNWVISDSMRGTVTGGDDEYLLPNSSGAAGLQNNYEFNASGFKVTTTNLLNTSGQTYIYIAIRRGPMGIPESASEVFDVGIDAAAGTFDFPVDMAMGILNRSTTLAPYEPFVYDRIRGNAPYLVTRSTNGEATGSGLGLDDNTGYDFNFGTGAVMWNWRRAPSFFDVVGWNTTSGSTNRRINHNLGVAPEMVIFRRRDGTDNWYTYHKDLGTNNFLRLNTSAILGGFTNCFNTATDTDWGYNESGFYAYADLPMIGYFFASLDGISKVGSYVGNNGTQNIDCGFSSGARFVLIKGVDYATNWYVFDTERGIVAGNDAELYLDADSVESISRDLIDPYSAGFSLTGNGVTNTYGKSYIYYAIA